MNSFEETKRRALSDASFVRELEKTSSINEIEELYLSAGLDINKEIGDKYIGRDGEINLQGLENVCGGINSSAVSVPFLINLSN